MELGGRTSPDFYTTLSCVFFFKQEMIMSRNNQEPLGKTSKVDWEHVWNITGICGANHPIMKTRDRLSTKITSITRWSSHALFTSVSDMSNLIEIKKTRSIINMALIFCLNLLYPPLLCFPGILRAIIFRCKVTNHVEIKKSLPIKHTWQKSPRSEKQHAPLRIGKHLARLPMPLNIALYA